MLKDIFQGKKLVIFGLNDTLAPTYIPWRRAFLIVANRIPGYWSYPTVSSGLTLAALWNTQILSQPKEVDVNIENLVVETQEKFLDLLNTEYEMEICPGFWDFLSVLTSKDIKIAVTSNSFRYVSDAIMSHIDVQGVFDYTVAVDEVSLPKPDPEIFNNVLDHFKLKPKDALVFEGNSAGLRAAASANIDHFLIRDAYDIDFSEYPSTIVGHANTFENFSANIEVSAQDIGEKLLEYTENHYNNDI